MLACKFQFLLSFVGWNLSFLRWISRKVAFWLYIQITCYMKFIFVVLWQIWKPVWLRNFLLIWKCCFISNLLGFFKSRRKIVSKKSKCSSSKSFSGSNHVSAQKCLDKLKNAILSESWKKATFFGGKHIFLLKNKRNF